MVQVRQEQVAGLCGRLGGHREARPGTEARSGETAGREGEAGTRDSGNQP